MDVDREGCDDGRVVEEGGDGSHVVDYWSEGGHLVYWGDVGDFVDYWGDVGHFVDYWSDVGDFVDYWGDVCDGRSDGEGDGVDAGAGLLNDGVEAAHGVGGVVHLAQVAVGLHQRVRAVHDVAVPLLPLRLVVARHGVVHCVVEGVAGVVLLME